ncbi:histidine phosphatase family protein [Streptomyces sp. CC208A]|uniref:histidine phosphatase family protein n=1 Tax=Streptomyces sp. CC208A TaxID=3044573 RepID=UPI0024A8A7F9|nr:histidine phosphatase family protein [Streptomyces sp. CC208A]
MTATTTSTAARYLYLTRHGEASSDESELTEAGRRQAGLLGERLRGVPLSAIHHGPLARAEQTARLIGERLDGVPLYASEAAGDYVPYTPAREELPPETADAMLGFLHQFPAEQREQGPALAAEAAARFTGPVDGDEPRHELVVTHNFLIGWLVRATLDAPAWRWMGINHANAALTVIRYAPGRPPALLLFNDTGHLPADLRWTGFPPELHV